MAVFELSKRQFVNVPLSAHRLCAYNRRMAIPMLAPGGLLKPSPSPVYALICSIPVHAPRRAAPWRSHSPGTGKILPAALTTDYVPRPPFLACLGKSGMAVLGGCCTSRDLLIYIFHVGRFCQS